MTRILAIGDPHFKVGNKKETDEMYLETEKMISTIPFDMIVVLGDVLDTHERIHLAVHKRACDFLLMLSEHSNVYVLVGNHDRMNNQDFMSDIHPFTGLEKDNLHIVYQTQKVFTEGKWIFFVPYVPPGMFNKALEYLDFEEDKTHVIFAHQEFMGAKMGAIESQIGDIWPEEYPTVISGHIHDYQILGNVIYAGTPFQHGFSDSIDKKLMIVTITTENIRIKRKKLNVTRKKSLKLTLEEFENFTPLENCITKVYIQGDSETIRQYLKANKERLEKYDLKVCIRDTSHSECDPEEKRISFEEYLKSKLGDELYLRFEEIMSTK